MERPSKRRRLYQRDGLRRAHRSSTEVGDPEANIAMLDEDKSHATETTLLQANLYGALNNPKQPETLGDEIQKVHPRQIVPKIVPNPVSQVTQPVTTAVKSVIRVIIDNPAGTAIGDVLVPAQSSVFTFDGYGSVTLPSNAGSPTSPPGPPARFASQSAYTTPGPQSEAPQPTQEPSPNPADQSSSRPSEAPPASLPASTNSPASQSPMTINVSGSSSQVVLSSPPATPVPSSSSSSLSYISATSTGSTASYFSLPSSASSASTSSQTSDIPNPNQNPTNLPVPAPTSGNFSMTSFTSSQTSTGPNGPTSLTFATPISNSTSITSTRTSSSSSSGTGTISSTSSQVTSTTSDTSSTMTDSSTMSISSTSSTSSQSPTLSSSSSASTTSSTGGVPGGIGDGSGSSSTGTAPSSTASSGTGSGGSSAPSTPTVVGGVVGGVAGLTIILLLLLVLFRWRRRKMARGRNISPPMAQTVPPASGAPSGTVTERSSNVPFAAAGFFKRMRPRSSATAATTETAPSERGFQNFGGRKIESVLESGGDGFGNAGPSSSAGPSPLPVRSFGVSPVAGLGSSFRPASPQTPLSETSFYRDSQGFYGGAPEPEPSSNPSSMYGRPESPPPRSPDRPGPATASSSPPARVGSQAQRDQEVAFMRPGPARTPVTNQPGFSSLRPPTGRGSPPPRPLPSVGASPTPRDGVGRSHPSFDGSRGSRFTEEMVPP